MNNKEFKMQLLKEFGVNDNPKSIDFCREAYKFLTEDEAEAQVSCCPSEVTAVDLGLPSGNLWADRNVCAKSPEDYGAFFSWGNVDPHFPNKENMDWGDDDYAFDYKFNSEEYKKTPGYKLEGNIDAEHDAATVNLGEPWRLPTEDDFRELYAKCDWVRKTINGVNGYLVTSKINGNSIFFPCSGYGYGASCNGRGGYGNYWSASFSSAASARHLLFDSGGVNPQYSSSRYYGFAVRPVQTSITNPKNQ